MKPKSSLLSFLAFSGSAMFAVTSANATQFWDGGGGDAKWNTAANWGADTLPAFNTTAINFGGTNAAGDNVGTVAALQTTANNDLTAGSFIKGINFTNNGTTGRTQAFTLTGNSILLGDTTNNGIVTTAITSGPVIEDVISLNIDLNAPGSGGEQNRQFTVGVDHHLRIDGVISGGTRSVLLARVTGSKLTLTNANNSYLGATNIAEGTASTAGALLEITSIANGGSNSSIGASSNAAENLRFSDALNDGSMNTLRYIGNSNGSTDRLFRFGGNFAGTNSAIESSGAGTLSFTNAGAIATTHNVDRNFYLGGTNTGDNTFAPKLGNFGTGVSTFTKQGVGKWIITGAHTYTGATNVEEGTLILNGSTHADSAVTVFSSAALGGDGTVGGDATFNNGSIFAWNLSVDTPGDTSSTTVADTLAVSGTLTDVGNDGGSIFKILLAGGQTFGDAFWNASHSWTDVLTSGNSLALQGLFTDFSYANASGTIDAPTTGTFSLSGSTLSFNISPIPEPTSALAGLLLAAGLLRRRRTA